MAEMSQAQMISVDIIAKLQQALENEEALSPDEPEVRQSVEQRLLRLLSLYDAGRGSKNAPRGSA